MLRGSIAIGNADAYELSPDRTKLRVQLPLKPRSKVLPKERSPIEVCVYGRNLNPDTRSEKRQRAESRRVPRYADRVPE